MTIKQFKARYAGSKFGIWWTVITPLLLAVSINFVFVAVFQINFPNYTLFVLAGIIPWFFFTNALTETMNSFLVSSSVLKQAILPLEFIPISSILANLFNFLIGFIFLLPLFIIMNFKVVFFLPLLFLVIMLHLFLIIGLGFIFSSFNLFFRDLSHFLSIGFMLWFWLTPVFYSLEMLPPTFRWICLLNPMTYFIILYQEILFKARIPQFPIISISFLISFFSCILGYTLFLNKKSALLKNI